jgi:hypothetical protein
MKHPGHTYGGFVSAISERGMTHWVKVLAAEASASESSGVVLESLVTASGTEGATFALAFAANSFVVA